MNVGKDKRHPKYICDKCGEEITQKYRKGFTNKHSYYKQQPKAYVNVKDFDLCQICEKKFRKWLQEKEIPTFEELIDRFPVYEERSKR